MKTIYTLTTNTRLITTFTTRSTSKRSTTARQSSSWADVRGGPTETMPSKHDTSSPHSSDHSRLTDGRSVELWICPVTTTTSPPSCSGSAARSSSRTCVSASIAPIEFGSSSEVRTLAKKLNFRYSRICLM